MSAAISSRIEMKDQYCEPEPTLPPSPALKIGISRFQAPPLELTTRPVRAKGTRIPASTAGCADASHCATTSARKPAP